MTKKASTFKQYTGSVQRDKRIARHCRRMGKTHAALAKVAAFRLVIDYPRVQKSRALERVTFNGEAPNYSLWGKTDREGNSLWTSLPRRCWILLQGVTVDINPR